MSNLTLKQVAYDILSLLRDAATSLNAAQIKAALNHIDDYQIDGALMGLVMRDAIDVDANDAYNAYPNKG
jgi:hypothetical protein